MTIRPDAPAFDPDFGLTKREYFAGLLMQALSTKEGVYYSPAQAAEIAVTRADALISRLNATT